MFSAPQVVPDRLAKNSLSPVTRPEPLIARVRAHVPEAVPSSAIAVPTGAHVALT